MNNQNYTLNSLSKDEVSTILESLLFSSSVDVCANWYKENSLSMLKIAKKIRTFFPEILIDNVYVVENKDRVWEHNDKHTDEIINSFPEIKKESFENV